MGGVLLLLLYIALGVFAAWLLFKEERLLKKLWLGSVMGIMLLMWSHVPFSFVMGFTVVSHLCGIFFAIVICFLIFLWKSKSFRDIKGAFVGEKGIKESVFPLRSQEIAMIVCTVSFSILAVTLLWNHTLFEAEGGYWTGQCTYGDMNMHLGFITSIAEQNMFPPTYSIMAGEPLNYPFLCDSVSSSLYLFGASLKTAYVAPAVVAFASVFSGFWFLAEAVLEKTRRTLLAFFLFFLDGGFGIIYFLDNLGGENKTNFTRIFTEFYETPTNYVNSGRDAVDMAGNTITVQSFANVRWTNVIADMLLPQRATLFGWTCLFAVLYILYMAVFKDKKHYFVIAGVMGGLITMVHTHSYFALGMIAIAWIIYSVIRDKFNKSIIVSWLSFGLPALALSVPQLLFWTFNAVGGESFLRFEFNWVNSQASGGTDSWLWFWVKNVGLVFVLLPVAFIHANKTKKLMYSGALLIFVVSELIIFQPNSYDNIKLFFIWYVFTVILVADFLGDCWHKLKGIRGRSVLAALLIFVCTISGTLTIGRELASGYYNEDSSKRNAYQLYSAAHVNAAEFIKENTEADAIFMCYNNHNNSIASLTGRNIYCGAGTFLYFHGIGYQERSVVLKEMFTNADAFEKNRIEAGIDYVFVGDYERGNYGSSLIDEYLAENYKAIYDQDGIVIYDVRTV